MTATVHAGTEGKSTSEEVVGTTTTRGLGRDTLIYGAGVVLSHAASFIMLPVYTRLLSPADYGILHLLQLTLDVAAIILGGGLTAGLFRFYFKAHDPRARLAVISTALLLLAATNGLGSAALFAAAGPLAALLLDDPAHAGLVHIVAVTFWLEIVPLIAMTLMQIQKRAVLYTAASVGRLVLQLTLNILFLVGFGWGVRGVLLSSLITAGALGLLTGGWMLKQTGLRFSADTARDLVRFGIPYKGTQVGTFILTFGDRYFLKALRGLTEVGIYSLAYQFGFVLVQVSANPVLKALNPRRFGCVEEPRAVRDRFYNRAFVFFNVMVISAAMGICLFVRPLLVVMSDPSFHAAANVVPVIVAAQVFAAWIAMFGFGIDVSEQTKYLTYATWVGVLFILALYSLLIPRYGGMGAAVATLLSFATRFGLVYWWAMRLWPIRYRWSPHVKLVAAAVALVWVNQMVQPGLGLFGQVVLAAALLVPYASVVWFGVLGDQMRAEVVRMVRRLLRQAVAGVRSHHAAPAGEGP